MQSGRVGARAGPIRPTRLLLEPQGRIDAFVRVTRTGDEELIVDTDSGWGEAVVARLERFKLRVKVEISILGWRCLAVRGPGAAGIAFALRACRASPSTGRGSVGSICWERTPSARRTGASAAFRPGRRLESRPGFR